MKNESVTTIPNFGLAFIGYQLIARQYPALQDPIFNLLSETAGEDTVLQWAREAAKRSMDRAHRIRRGCQKKPKPIKMSKEQFLKAASDIWQVGIDSDRRLLKSTIVLIRKRMREESERIVAGKETNA